MINYFCLICKDIIEEKNIKIKINQYYDVDVINKNFCICQKCISDLLKNESEDIIKNFKVKK